MTDIAIKIENVSKLYRLGTVGSSTMKEDFSRWWGRLRGKGEASPMGSINRLDTQDGNYVWALQNINLEIMQGDVIGIIGKNGAGKSTLLKILSKITAPTKGEIKIKGRIASLLEVGTGFHGELTGRENIFLNGVILGMTRSEIRKKFDEIVDFSGVGKYIDTPVKRYSSGMYVRLAFAVAAHLEPEILIVDEVLAVGDAEFQKKAIGKMNSISKGEGRTVLFVSHNMVAINSLCNKATLLEKGFLTDLGDAQTVVKEYVQKSIELNTNQLKDYQQYGDSYCQLLNARMIDENHQTIVVANINQIVGVEYEYEILQNNIQAIPNLCMYDMNGITILLSSEKQEQLSFKKGIYKSIMWIPKHFFNTGKYYFELRMVTFNPYQVHFEAKEILYIELIEDISQRNFLYTGHLPGVIRPNFEWKTTKVN